MEKGEYRHKDNMPRIVRVESNCGKDDKISIYNRLLRHRGNIAGAYAGGGNHRLSLLRKHIGTAILKKNKKTCETWEQEKFNAAIRKAEQWLEIMVSDEAINMEVIILPIEDNKGLGKVAKYIEQNSIALLSNFSKYPIDSPSPGWLGKYCGNDLVRESGLWNTNGVMMKYDRAFLEMFEKIMKACVKCN